MTPTCLSCIALGVGEWVDQFYRALKLVPWWQWMPTYRRDGRQSGRSTHGMLEAIALAHESRIPRISVCSPYGRFADDLLREQVKRFAKQLGVVVEVTPYRRGELSCVNYTDHGIPVVTGDLRG